MVKGLIVISMTSTPTYLFTDYLVSLVKLVKVPGTYKTTYNIVLDGVVIGHVSKGFKHSYGNEWKAWGTPETGHGVRGWDWETRKGAVANFLRNYLAAFPGAFPTA